VPFVLVSLVSGRRVSVNKELLTGTVPVNKELLTGTVPVNKKLLTGTVPVNNFYLRLNLFANQVQLVHAVLNLTCGPRQNDLVPASGLDFKLLNILKWCMIVF